MEGIILIVMILCIPIAFCTSADRDKAENEHLRICLEAKEKNINLNACKDEIIKTDNHP